MKQCQCLPLNWQLKDLAITEQLKWEFWGQTKKSNNGIPLVDADIKLEFGRSDHYQDSL